MFVVAINRIQDIELDGIFNFIFLKFIGMWFAGDAPQEAGDEHRAAESQER